MLNILNKYIYVIINRFGPGLVRIGSVFGSDWVFLPWNREPNRSIGFFFQTGTEPLSKKTDPNRTNAVGLVRFIGFSVSLCTPNSNTCMHTFTLIYTNRSYQITKQIYMMLSFMFLFFKEQKTSWSFNISPNPRLPCSEDGQGLKQFQRFWKRFLKL